MKYERNILNKEKKELRENAQQLATKLRLEKQNNETDKSLTDEVI
jgi:hypothetical protein